MIKFFNIYKQDKNISEKIITDIKKIIKSNSFINGTAVNNFEKNIVLLKSFFIFCVLFSLVKGFDELEEICEYTVRMLDYIIETFHDLFRNTK